MSDLPIRSETPGERTVDVVQSAVAWGQVVTLALTEITSWGILYHMFPLFLGPMGHELGWSQASMTGAYSLALLISGLMAVPVGRWLDHTRSPRALMAGGSLLGVGGLLAWAGVTTLPVFYGLWVALGIAMAATLYEPAFATVAAWFIQRERALTVLTTVSGLASVIYLPVAALVVERAGWRAALLVLAVMLLVGAALPHVIVLRPYPAIPRTSSPPAGVVRSPWRVRSFWQLVAGFALTQIAISALLVYLIPYLGQRGMPATQAATASGLIGIVALVGRLLATWRSTAQTLAAITSACFLALAAGIALLTLVHGLVGLALFIVLFGAGFGIYSPARAGLVADRFGTAVFGRVNGHLALVITLARAAGPASAGLLLLRGADYALVFWLLAFLAALGALLLWLPGGHSQVS